MLNPVQNIYYWIQLLGITMNALDSLRSMTTVVSDTGDIKQIEKYKPQEATTNPSLILQSAQNPEYAHFIDDAILYGKKIGGSKEKQVSTSLDEVFILFAKEITKIIPGRVSVEVDARLSFDIEGSIAKAVYLIERFEANGIPKERILIKLASTWEGLKAAEELEKRGIHCNMTLLFSLSQALGAHFVNATLISPFVGRILDWYKKHEGKSDYPAEQDPGVLSVKELYSVLKGMGSKVQIMGASFRNAGEIEQLAGCDFLTIAPKFLEELSNKKGTLDRKLSPAQNSKNPSTSYKALREKEFRFELNENAMASEKLSEGIRLFSEDIRKLQKILEDRI